MTRTLRTIHRWLGLLLMAPLLIQGITGTILAAAPAIEALRSVPVVARGEARPASAILAAAASPGMVPVHYQPPAGPGAPASVGLAAPGQRMAQIEVLVDPVSLATLGTRHASAVYLWVRALHEGLLLPAPLGRSVVGWFGLGLLVLALSGLVLWWPSPGRWRAAFAVSGAARGARLQRELHGAAGIWACAMLVVMSLSGVAMAFPQTVRAALGVPGGGGGAGGFAGPLDIDAVIARVQAAAPGAVVTDLRLPGAPGRPVVVRLRAKDGLAGAPPLFAMVDPAGRRVLSLQDPRAGPAAGAMLAWLRAMHFGEAFGPLWRLAVCVTGCLLPLLAVTGITLWLLRRRIRHRVAVQRHAALQAAAP